MCAGISPINLERTVPDFAITSLDIDEAQLWRDVDAFFARVRTSMKTPSILLLTRDNQTIKLGVAGSQARFPGSINVTDPNQKIRNQFGDAMAVWYGRIVDGEFQPSPAGREHRESLVSALKRFLVDPVEGARDFAKLTGCCSFCNLPLKDARSQKAGYGKTCATKYNLPWG
jgi:hypothetical protein